MLWNISNTFVMKKSQYTFKLSLLLNMQLGELLLMMSKF